MKKITLLFTAIFWIIFKLNAITIVVPTDYNNIQAAIDNASNGDTIEVLPGIYSGTGNFNIDFNGKEIVLQSLKGRDSTIIDCEQLDRAFYFHSNETKSSVVDGFTIINGNAKTDGDNGGGIHCNWSNPTIKNCTIKNCVGNPGGAIHLLSSSPTIENCLISGNSASWVFYCYSSSPIIRNTEITGNEGATILAIIDYSNPTIDNCKIHDNIGDGIGVVLRSNPVITNTKIINNSRDGINTSNNCKVTLINCLITKNRCGINSVSDILFNIRNCNIIFNDEYGIKFQQTYSTISNSILYGNNYEEINVVTSPIPNVSYSLVEGKDDNEIIGNINWSGNNYYQYPMFLDTLSGDYRVSFESPCIENGNPNTSINENEKDLANNERIMGRYIDIGAYEYCLDISEETEYICSGDSIYLKNNWQKESGNYSDTIIDQNGCVSIISTDLIVYSPSDSTIDENVCNYYTSPSGKYSWAESGTYKDTILNTFGCDSVLTINLTVNRATYSTIPETACDNYISPSGKYSWTTSGTYKDTIPNADGCDSIITINLDIISINTDVQLNNGILTAMENDASYIWETCPSQNIINGAIERSYKPIVTGLYAVRISKSGCEALSSCYSIVVTDIEEKNMDNTPILYPNPTKDYLTIELRKFYNNIELEIIDINGKVISKKQYTNLKTLKLNASTLMEGEYIIRLLFDDKETKFKILKK